MHNAGKIGRRTSRLGSILLAGMTISLIGANRGYDPTSAAMQQGLKGEFGKGDGQKTLRYLRHLDFTIESTGDSILTGDFTCKNCTTGYLKNGYIRLMFIPENDAHHVDWADAAEKGGRGEVVALVINMDIKTLPEIDLPPGGIAYAWVGQIDAIDTRGFGIYRIDKTTGMRAGMGWWVTATLKHCPDKEHNKPAIKKNHPITVPDVCNPIASGTPSGSVSLASTSPGLFMLPPGDGGSLWVSCSGGCCEVGAAK